MTTVGIFRAPVAPANDNLPKEHLVGSGNVPWSVGEHFGKLALSEVFVVSKPLRILQDTIEQAIEVMRTNTAAQDCCAVYVVGDVQGAECKIGKATDPIKRLAQLQTGNPRQLFLHRVFWLKQKEADEVELLAHEFAEESQYRLMGEWFRCAPNEAHDAIVSAIRNVHCIKSYCAMTPIGELMGVAA